MTLVAIVFHILMAPLCVHLEGPKTDSLWLYAMLVWSEE